MHKLTLFKFSQILFAGALILAQLILTDVNAQMRVEVDPTVDLSSRVNHNLNKKRLKKEKKSLFENLNEKFKSLTRPKTPRVEFDPQEKVKQRLKYPTSQERYLEKKKSNSQKQKSHDHLKNKITKPDVEIDPSSNNSNQLMSKAKLKSMSWIERRKIMKEFIKQAKSLSKKQKVNK